MPEAPEEPRGDNGPQLPDDYDEPPPPPDDAVPMPMRLNAWRKRSATGAMLAGSFMGLQKVLKDEPERDEIVLEVDNPSEPEDQPVGLDLDPFDPGASVATLRPWLLAQEI